MRLDQVDGALNRLAKWRMVFTGWQLGTRAKGDPEGDAVRDHRELSILLRAEVNALEALLVEKGVFTAAEFREQLGDEAEWLSGSFERKFPGAKATDSGMDFDMALASQWMKGWRP